MSSGPRTRTNRKRWSTNTRLRKRLHAKGVMKLRINGPALGLRGYTEEAAKETDSESEESAGEAEA